MVYSVCDRAGGLTVAFNRDISEIYDCKSVE